MSIVKVDVNDETGGIAQVVVADENDGVLEDEQQVQAVNDVIGDLTRGVQDLTMAVGVNMPRTCERKTNRQSWSQESMEGTGK
ncbi:hypothetical protein JTB14_002135 [Gonioctena quinquepunctata]|nr:hypothetical protein JTB14_002135 [Gonioctena quinquepunctata]